MIDLEMDSTGNPFIAMFPDAVAFKVKYAIDQCFNADRVIDEVSLRRSSLEDPDLEIFLYPTPKTLAAAIEIFQSIAEITAILSFIDGGITMFGWHYQVVDRQLKTEKVEGYAIQ